MNFKMFIEGLIRIPEKMFESCKQVAIAQILGCIKSLLSDKNYPEHEKAFNEAKKKFGIKPANFTGENSFHDIEYDLTGIPDKLKDFFTHGRSVFTIYIDWQGKVTNKNQMALYLDKKKNGEPMEIMVLNLNRVLRYLQNDPSDVFYFVKSVSSDIRHELMHLIQKRSIQSVDPKQTQMNYSNNRDDYYTSNIEFSPQIDSAVFDFIQTVKQIKNPNLPQLIRIYVGAEKPSFISGIQPDSFFLALRKSDQKKYQKAVSLFYKELRRQYEV